jgi:hypothetical protein
MAKIATFAGFSRLFVNPEAYLIVKFGGECRSDRIEKVSFCWPVPFLFPDFACSLGFFGVESPAE